MSTFNVSPRFVSALHPIVGADRIELAQVDGYQVVVQKGKFKPGDWAIYIPEQAILPDEMIREMGLEGRLSGGNKNRVKAVRLRGCLSQGLLYDMPEWAERDTSKDYAERLGITKWTPFIPPSMSGQLVPAPDLMRWCEVENIRKLRWQDPETGVWFDPLEGLAVEVTEKVHGTCFIATMMRDGTAMVSSKGVAGRACSLVEDERNLYWRAYREHGLGGVLADVLRAYPAAPSASIYGEVFGAGVQDLTYGLAGTSFAAFDVRAGSEWLPRSEWEPIIAGNFVATVPLLYTGQYDYEAVWALAKGQNIAGSPGAHIREGVVVRPVPERLHGGDRLIAKFVSEDYLLRSGGSEYE